MSVSFTGKSLIHAIILCLIIFSLCLAYHYFTNPGTYEDCVLTYLKADTSNYAANFIDDMCEAKFKN